MRSCLKGTFTHPMLGNHTCPSIFGTHVTTSHLQILLTGSRLLNSPVQRPELFSVIASPTPQTPDSNMSHPYPPPPSRKRATPLTQKRKHKEKRTEKSTDRNRPLHPQKNPTYTNPENNSNPTWWTGGDLNPGLPPFCHSDAKAAITLSQSLPDWSTGPSSKQDQTTLNDATYSTASSAMHTTSTSPTRQNHKLNTYASKNGTTSYHNACKE